MAQVFDDHPAFRVVGAFDPAGSTARVPFPMRETAGEVVADPAANCIYVASPPSTHLEHVQAAVRAGKAVFCEKPLAVSLTEAEACVDIVHRAGIPAAVNFPFATSWAARQLRHLVAEQALGPVHSAWLTMRFARWPRAWQSNAESWLSRPEQGGFMREVGSHFVFLANRMFGNGELKSVEISRGASGSEQSIKATLQCGTVTMHIDGAVSGNLSDVNRFEVAGEMGSAALTDWQRLDYRGTLSDRINSLPNQMEALRLMLSGATAHGLASFEEAADVARVVEAVLSA